MKTILIIFTILFLNTFIAKSSENNDSEFNKWLFDNRHSKYVTKKENKICANETKFSQAWYLQKCDKFQGSNNLNIEINNKALSATNIAYHSNPNRDSLIYYLWKYLSLIHI